MGTLKDIKNRKIECPLCHEVMDLIPPSKPGGRDYYWKCYGCNVEVWPPDENIERQIRREFGRISGVKKRSGSGKGRRFRRPKKPGEKFVPWWMR